MKRYALSSALLCLVATGTVSTAQQATSGLLDSYQHARRALDAAVAAHGGLEALRAARQMRVVLGGHDVWRHQSRRVEPPYDREPYHGVVHIDLEKGRLVVEQARTYPGGAHNWFRFVTDGTQSSYVDLRRQTFQPQDYPPAETQTNNLYALPQHALLHAQDSGFALRWLGPVRLAGGAVVDAIATSTPYGALTIGLDPALRQLRALLGVRRDAVAGDTTLETEFLDYRTLSGVLLPSRRVVRVAGEVTQEHSYEAVEGNYHVPDALVTAPPGFARATPPPVDAVQLLAPGVWRIGSGTAVLAVAFQDHVLVVDAGGSSAEVLSRLASLAPGKPVRYVAPTHHHDDHAGGVRTYAAAGATILTTPGNVSFMRLLGATTVEVITDHKRVISDGNQTVELHDIGAGPHAEEMLIAWIPNHGILFQADLITASPAGEVARGGNNETTMHFAAWLRERGWNVRRFAGAHASVSDADAFAKLIAQPLLPARQ